MQCQPDGLVFVGPTIGGSAPPTMVDGSPAAPTVCSSTSGASKGHPSNHPTLYGFPPPVGFPYP
eukprot:1182620-Prorocentrum_lima.AAC.1